MKFKSNSPIYFLVVFLLLVLGVSFFRLMIRNDYIVVYEGECDSAISSCFIGCEDDECNEEYYYTQVQKYAPDLYNECGSDITDCPEASVCLDDDKDCSITYCDPEIDGEDACVRFTSNTDEEDSNLGLLDQNIEGSTSTDDNF